MIFGFRILGLFLLFILVCSYFLKDNKHRNTFSYVLIGTYFLEFMYLICYIFGKNSFDNAVMVKIYYGIFLMVLSIYSYYIYSFMIQKKYKLDHFTLDKKKKVGDYFLFCVVIIIVGILMLIHDEMVLFRVVLAYAGLSVFGYFCMLLFGKNLFDRMEGRFFLGFSFIYALLLMLQISFPSIEILESGMILLTTYLYVFVENVDRKEANDLKIERDYAMKNVLQKETFLKKLSHEIRTPIHTIDGFSQIIEDIQDMDEIKEDVKDIRQASLDLIDLINGMIDLSILEAGELKLYPEAYNVYDVLDDFAEMIPARLKSKDVKFQFHMEKGIPEVLKGDSERICQVILNIISNSIKYTDKGSISMDVTSVKSSSFCRLIIKISDTGIGMSDEEVQQLLNDDSNDKGIGLKIAYYLLELMNGKLDIQSVADKGTDVVVTIDQEIVAMKQDQDKKRERKHEIVSFKGKRVLLVDDNKLNLKVAEKLLLPYDLEIVSVNSGQECLDTLDQDHNFDLVMMDDLMPNMSGTETLDVLRKIERVAGYYIPVVVLTANATTGMREKYLENGFDDYLAKPINRDDLDQVLKKYLKK